MITTYRIALSTATLLFFTSPTHAQQPAQEGTGGGTVTSYAQAGQDRPQTAIVRMPAPQVHAPVITGAPYCAEVATEHIQTLADGTHITNKSRGTKECRDSEGRTRTETSPAGAHLVEIHDPVSGFRYLLDVQNRVAHRFAPPGETTKGAATYTQTVRADSSVSDAAPARGAAPPPPQANRPESVTESLGNQVIEGVMVEGKKTTTTFPVGAMGNDRPIVRVSESWFSPGLKRTLLLKNFDPRMGESTMRLESIDSTEPDPALFRVPPDYQIVDTTGDQVEIKVTRP